MVNLVRGEDYWRVWSTRTASNILAELTVVPAVVGGTLAALRWWRRGASRPRLEGVVLGLSLIGIAWLNLSDSASRIPPLRAMSSGKSAGLVCMACRRAYEPGLRSCPHDGNELVPFPVYNATRPRRAARATEPAGVIARICPVCGTKYDLNARFCGHDAGLLVVIN